MGFEITLELHRLRKKLKENQLTQENFFRLVEIEYLWGILSDLEKIETALDKLRTAMEEAGLKMDSFSFHKLEMPEKLRELLEKEEMIQADIKERKGIYA